MGGDGGGGNKNKKCDTHTQDRNEHGEYGNYGFEWQTGDFLCVIYIFFLSTTKYQEKKMETSGPHGLKMPTTVSNDDILFSYKRERNKKKHKRNAAAALRRKYRPLYMLYNDRLSITLIIIIIIIIISLAVHFLPH